MALTQCSSCCHDECGPWSRFRCPACDERPRVSAGAAASFARQRQLHEPITPRFHSSSLPFCCFAHAASFIQEISVKMGHLHRKLTRWKTGIPALKGASTAAAALSCPPADICCSTQVNYQENIPGIRHQPPPRKMLRRSKTRKPSLRPLTEPPKIHRKAAKINEESC